MFLSKEVKISQVSMPSFSFGPWLGWRALGLGVSQIYHTSSLLEKVSNCLPI